MNIKKLKWDDFQTPIFKIILIICVVSLINFILTWALGKINYEDSGSFFSMLPYSITLLPAYIIAKTLDRKTLIFLLIFICFEIVVGIFEYVFGVTSFFITANEFASGYGGDEMLYNKRVLGISTNSSTLAIKCLIGLIIVYLTKPKYSILWVLLIIVGFYVSFNRATIIAAAPLLIYFYWYYISQLKFKIFWLGLTVIVCVSLFSVVINQFMRSADISDISRITANRDLIYESFYAFSKENIWNGNGSVKLWLELFPDHKFHAHNSYLMTLASNGIIVFLFYLYFIFAFIRKSNFLPVSVLLIYSLFQFGILWGCSLTDIIFIFLLLDKKTSFIK
ncbi:MAG: O-antigen ligase family protein [Firmicutes bacterium]|nr:O-antigen ligase family protein [Bacillota bacterium]